MVPPVFYFTAKRLILQKTASALYGNTTYVDGYRRYDSLTKFSAHKVVHMTMAVLFSTAKKSTKLQLVFLCTPNGDAPLYIR